MDLLADENQHPRVVDRLRVAGHAVEWPLQSAPGTQDVDILARPDIGGLIFLTYDRDFGDLIFNRRLPAPLAILYTRLTRTDPIEIGDRLVALLDTGVAAGHMTTITKDGERTRPFPPGATHG